MAATRVIPDASHSSYLLRRAGWQPGQPFVHLWRLNEGRGQTDPFEWDQQARTIHVAHRHIEKEWDRLECGAVVDVEFILGLRPAPKKSEFFDEGGFQYRV